ncbi:hypothetical protein AYI70_g8813 [Smittium culicis]|uniref:Uncharacterized protein n=1 Tax=Smittium culicis TaxID=133412 RepID=A0A1R1XE83_9FUNG|nr:hypothetical protein AYI70_g8813 [Smittium culicis]
MRLSYSFKDSLYFGDVISDLKSAWSGSYYTYHHFDPIVQDDTIDTVDSSIPSSAGDFSGSEPQSAILSSNEADNIDIMYPRELGTKFSNSSDSDSNINEMNDNSSISKNLIKISSKNRIISEKRLKAGMRYTKGGKEVYWVNKPAHSSSHPNVNSILDKKEHINRDHHMVINTNLPKALNHISSNSNTKAINMGADVHKNKASNLMNSSLDGISRDKRYTSNYTSGNNEHLIADVSSEYNQSSIRYIPEGHHQSIENGDAIKRVFLNSVHELDFEEEAFGPNGVYQWEIDMIYLEAKRVGCDPNYPVISKESHLNDIPWINQSSDMGIEESSETNHMNIQWPGPESSARRPTIGTLGYGSLS